MTSFVYFEDDPFSRDVLHTILTRMLGYEQVVLFEDSTDFVARLEALSFVPDVFFIDIQMPPYDGFEVLQRLRTHALFRDARMVAVTASVLSAEIHLLRQAGFDGVIGKPIDRRTFPGLLDRILNGESVWHPT